MARTANDGRVNVYPSEVIKVSGEMENGHELEIYIGKDQACLLQAALNFADRVESGHLGHAFWHAKNPERPFPCEHPSASCSPLKPESKNTDSLDALYAFADHVPELWGDEVQDGYIRLNVSADTIHQIEAAIQREIENGKR